MLGNCVNRGMAKPGYRRTAPYTCKHPVTFHQEGGRTGSDRPLTPAAATVGAGLSTSSQSIPCPVPSPRKRMRRFFWLALRCRIASRRRSLESFMERRQRVIKAGRPASS